MKVKAYIAKPDPDASCTYKVLFFNNVPLYPLYAFADRIYRVLFGFKAGIMPNLERKEAEGQPLAPFAVQLS